MTRSPTPPFIRRRRQKRQRSRIVFELLIGGAAIWFVMHPRSAASKPTPKLAAFDSLFIGDSGTMARGVRDDSRATGVERTGVERTGVERTAVERIGVERIGVERTGVERTGAAAPFGDLPIPRLPAALLPSVRLFKSIEERARAGERVPVSMTAYCLQGRTRRGNLVRDGIIAVDRALFPLGRDVDLFIGRKMLGRYLADDTGGAIKGGRIDVWMADCGAARRFGRRRGFAQLVRKSEK